MQYTEIEQVKDLAAITGGRAARLVETVVITRSQNIRARDRGDTMVLLAQNAAEAGIDAHIESREPDGAMWSMTINGARTPNRGTSE